MKFLRALLGLVLSGLLYVYAPPASDPEWRLLDSPIDPWSKVSIEVHIRECTALHRWQGDRGRSWRRRAARCRREVAPLAERYRQMGGDCRVAKMAEEFSDSVIRCEEKP